MRLDIVTNDAGEGVRREHARELGAGVVVALYRLAKLAQLHDLGNQAFTRQLEQTHQIIGDYCLRSGSNVNVLFAKKAVFVAGQLLKGSRGTYEAATELGELFERFGGSELLVQRDVSREDLLGFAEQISSSHRGQPFRSPTPKIRLRAVADSARLRGLELESLTDDKRIVRMYASAVVIMRRFFEDLQASRYVLPRRIKRIAQSLVDLGAGSAPAFLGVTEVRNANFDEAGRAVNTAILAVSMAREVTQERPVLAQIAMAAMMHDVARPRAMALSHADGPPLVGMHAPAVLSEDQEDRLASGVAAVLTAVGRVNEPSITRTVLAFEAQWIRRRTWLGPVYWGARPPTLHATVIAVAQRYNGLLTPEPGLEPPTPDVAVAVLAEELKEAQERAVLRMLVAALGLLPQGTVVQLATGEMAEVIRGPRSQGESPRVRLLTDSSGRPTAPVEMELAEDRHRRVVRVVSVDGWRKGIESRPADVGPLHAADDGKGRSDEGALAAALRHGIATQKAAPSAVETSAIRSSSASLPSIGSSPSSVAGAMGRVVSRPPSGEVEADRAGRPQATEAAMDRATHRPARSTAEPTARGNVATTPLPHVLVYMLEHGLSGSVAFETGGGGDTLYFVGGVPTKVRLREHVALLGDVLVHGGAMPADAVDAAVQEARKLGVLLGRYLVEMNLVSREALAWALEAQLLNKVAYLANLEPKTTYAFYRDIDLLGGWGDGVRTGCSLNPIVASVRNWTDRARVRATLTRIGKHPLALHANAALENLALLPDETLALDVLRATRLPLAELLARNVAPEDVVSSLVYSLAVTRQFSFKGQTKWPMATASPSAAPVAEQPAPIEASVGAQAPPARGSGSPSRPPTGAPSASSPPPRASVPPVGVSSRKMMPAALPSASPRVPQIRRVAGRKTTMVGIQAASTAEQRTTSGRTDEVVPPTSHGAGPAPVVNTPPDGALTVARRSSAALGDEGLADVERALEAMQSYRLAQAALQRSDLASARQLAEKAVARDPMQGEYRALLAWIRALSDSAAVDEAIATISRVLIDDPSNESALFYRAKLRLRSNRLADAARDFTEVLAINPQHQEARAELRALEKKGTSR